MKNANNALKNLLIFALLSSAIGCAVAQVEVGQMVLTSDKKLESTNQFYQQIEIGATSGSALGFGPHVTNGNFQQALLDSLKILTALNSDKNGKYVLNTTLKSIDTPYWGISFPSDAVVNYVVVEKVNGKIVLDQIVQSHGEAKFSESLLGYKRSGLARGRSVQENFEKLFELLQNFKD